MTNKLKPGQRRYSPSIFTGLEAEILAARKFCDRQVKARKMPKKELSRVLSMLGIDKTAQFSDKQQIHTMYPLTEWNA